MCRLTCCIHTIGIIRLRAVICRWDSSLEYSTIDYVFFTLAFQRIGISVWGYFQDYSQNPGHCCSSIWCRVIACRFRSGLSIKLWLSLLLCHSHRWHLHPLVLLGGWNSIIVVLDVEQVLLCFGASCWGYVFMQHQPAKGRSRGCYFTLTFE